MVFLLLEIKSNTLEWDYLNLQMKCILPYSNFKHLKEFSFEKLPVQGTRAPETISIKRIIDQNDALKTLSTEDLLQVAKPRLYVSWFKLYIVLWKAVVKKKP